MVMDKPIRVLVLEDDQSDFEFIKHVLITGGIRAECRQVSTRANYEQALDYFAPDVVLLDCSLPAFDGRAALEIVRRKREETPAIVVTGALGDEAAVELLRLGAADCVLKDRSARLPSAVIRALEDEHKRRERLATHRELEAKLILLETQQESSPDGILVIDKNGQVISQNRRFCEIWRVPEHLREGASDHELLRHVTSMLKKPAEFLERVAQLYAHPELSGQEELALKDGRTLERYTASMFDSLGVYLGRIWFFREITEQLAAAKEIRLFRTLLDKSNDMIAVVDLQTMGLLDVNERACVAYGYAREELQTMRILDLENQADSAGMDALRDRLRNSGAMIFETKHHRKDGSTFPVEVSLSYVPSEQEYAVAVVRDITERKRAQKDLEESEMRFRTLIEDASDPVAIVDRDGTIRYSSPATLEMSGFDPREMIGRKMDEFAHPDDLKMIVGKLASAIDCPMKSYNVVSRMRRKDGTWRVSETTLRSRLGVAPIDGVVITFRDVTLRERSVRALAAMSATDAALIRAADEQTLAEQICQIMVNNGGYRMAWIGSPVMDQHCSIRILAQAGECSGYLERSQLSWADVPSGRGPTGTAVRTKKTQVSREDSGTMAGSKIEAGQLGYFACVAIPLAGPNGVFGVITLYSNDSAAFDDDEVKLLEQLAADVSYGIEAMRDRKQHAVDLERLEKTMEATIQAIASMVETRDPYTAGHERRVAMLAGAIASEMGLDPERVRALQLAATIHDVGKIGIPTEILVRPGGLSPIEYSLVKTHPQAGYEILRNIDFPWPIAEMVQQHHESLDGSGYPMGLKGSEILLESRILTVADVVEAMSSHRPYRPGWGLDAALEEVKKGSAIHFDPEVVDACVRLFHKNGFQLG